MEGERMAPTTRAVAFLDALAGALGGPLFTRELRVASRKGRTYLLRCLYVLGLAAAFLAMLGSAAYSMNAAFGMARAALFASIVAHVITWANFVVAQLIAVSALGAVMSDEARQRTLGTVLTTPLGAGRFVTGMLLGRLVQPLSIVALSFPCIVLLRVFGGIPWQQVGAGFCVTVTTACLAGALALCLSVYARRAASVSGAAGGLMLLLHITPPMVWALSSFRGGAGGADGGLVAMVLFASPSWVLETACSGMAPRAGWPGGSFLSLWPLHCALALGATALLLALAAARFRGSALRHVFPAPWRKDRAKSGAASLRPVRGNALAWKDSVTNRHFSDTIIAIIVCVLALAAIAVMQLPRAGIVVGILMMPITILTGVLVLAPPLAAAESVAREKEARTWPVVLMLPFTDGEVIKGKLLGLVRKNVRLWVAVYAGMAAMFVTSAHDGLSDFRPILLFCVLVPRVASVSFLGLALGLWASVTDATARRARINTLLLFVLVPAVGQLLISACYRAIEYQWRGAAVPDVLRYGAHALVPMVLEIGLGLLILGRATKHVRAARA